MNELSHTRTNHLIDPSMHVWGWEIPVYLFLGGLVAGMMIIAGYFLFMGRHKEPKCSCFYLPIISTIVLSIGMFALFLDLEHKLYFWRLYTTFQLKSPMSWGAWILVLVYPALFANILIRPPEIISNKFRLIASLSEKINRMKNSTRLIGILNISLGVLLGVYTGILLSALGARPLWNTSILWMLFLISGLSAAAAFVHLIAKDVQEREMLAKADNTFLTVELIVIILLIVGALSSTQAHIDAINIILTGPFAASFWVFVVGLGIIIPLIFQVLAVQHKIIHTPVFPIMVIVGGLILRFIIVYAGQYSHWSHTVLGK
ncbi:MAG: polysulfide reductase NrfD [Ignavibacteriales bacterium]|nr:MAG: polysulfide reductase NrfD [Ignavibacteriales bacterium]